MRENPSEHFLATGRGRLLPLLRGRNRTVAELAEALEVTDNAVRAHLSALIEGGFVAPTGLRPGLRRPHEIFTLTAKGEDLFPKSYQTLLSTLLSILGERLTAAGLEEILDELGRRLAKEFPALPQPADVHQRLTRAVEIVSELGGAAELRTEHGQVGVCGLSCPFGGLIAEHPEICRLAEKLLAQSIGLQIREACEKGAAPRCRFLVATELGA